MAVQINVAANQAALTASIQAGVQAYNQRFAQNNPINLSINQRAFSQPLGRMTGDVKDFEAALAASNARVIAFGASTAVLGGVIRSFKELANVTIDVEKNLADINRVFGLTTSQLQKFSTDLFGVGKQTASSFDDASKAALEFSRQGLKAEEVLIRTKDALTLTRLAGISTANAVDALTSTVNGFAATGISTTQILNKLVAVEQDYAVGAGDLAEALSRTGQAAQEAGVSLDQLNALVTSAQQSTARGGAVIGNALKTIFTRLQRTDTLDQLEAFNISVRDVQGNILPAVQILQNFAGAYKGLADAQRAQLSEQVAGVYQVNILKAIVGDLNKSQGVYAGALQRGASATNEAEVATAKLNQTLDALLKQTATSTQQLANNIGKVTFEPLARYGTEQLKSLVESMNEILEGEGVGSTFANGLLKGIRNIIAGPGAIAAFFTLFKLIQNSFTYLAQALPQIAGITTETQNRKNIEQSILQIMQQQGPVSQALAGTMGNQAAQAQLLLQLARQQTAEYQIQSTLAKELATQLAGQGVRVKGSGGLQATRAGGYIPNATRMAEAVGAQAGGYAPGKVVKSPVGGVMNTAEDVKYVPGFAQPFINPPAGSKAGRTHRQNSISRTGVDPYMNSGFIPNFSKTTPIRTLPENKTKSAGLLKNLYDFDKPTDLYNNPEYKIERFSLPFTSKEYDSIGQKYIDRAIKYKQNIENFKYRNIELSKFLSLKFNQNTLNNQDPTSKRNNLNNVKGALGEIDTYKYFEPEYYKAEKMSDAFGMDFAISEDDDESNIKRLVSLVETKTNKKLVADEVIIAKTLTYLGQKGKYKNNSPQADKITLPSELALFQPKGLPTNNIGFIPNFAPPTSAIRIPWFKKFGNAAFDKIQPTLGISKASDIDTFRQIGFRSTAKGADENGDPNIFGLLYETFSRKALQLINKSNIFGEFVRGSVLQPRAKSSQTAFDDALLQDDGIIGFDFKGFPKKNLSGGSVAKHMNDKLKRVAQTDPEQAAKIKEGVMVFNETGHENQLPSEFGKNFLELAGTSYSQILKNSPDLVKGLSAETNSLLNNYVKDPAFLAMNAAKGFVPNFGRENIATNIYRAQRGSELFPTKGTDLAGTNFRGEDGQKILKGSFLFNKLMDNIAVSVMGPNAYVPDASAIDGKIFSNKEQTAENFAKTAALNLSGGGAETSFGLEKGMLVNAFGNARKVQNPDLVYSGKLSGKVRTTKYDNIGKVLGRFWSRSPETKAAWEYLENLVVSGKSEDKEKIRSQTAILTKDYAAFMKKHDYAATIVKMSEFRRKQEGVERGVDIAALRDDLSGVSEVENLTTKNYKSKGVNYGEYKLNKTEYDKIGRWKYDNLTKKMFLQNKGFIPNFGLSEGFIPNFAYKQAVMGLEESMSGEKAVFDTKPFPHIRNKSQPTFSSAISDHGGLSNALSDSMRGQKNAGLMNRGYIPNFAKKGKKNNNKSKAPASAALTDADIDAAISNLLTSIQNLDDQMSIFERMVGGRGKLIDAELGKLKNSLSGGGVSGAKLDAAMNKASTEIKNTQSKFSKNLSSASTAISIAGPMIAGVVEQAAFGDRKRTDMSATERGVQSGLSTGLTAVSTGVGIGANFGLAGAAIGGLIGVAVGLTSAFSATKLSAEELMQLNQEQTQKAQANITAASSYVEAQKSLTQMILSGASSSEIDMATKKLSDNFNEIKDVKLQEIFNATGGDVTLMTKQLQEYTNQVTKESAKKTGLYADKLTPQERASALSLGLGKEQSGDFIKSARTALQEAQKKSDAVDKRVGLVKGDTAYTKFLYSLGDADRKIAKKPILEEFAKTQVLETDPNRDSNVKALVENLLNENYEEVLKILEKTNASSEGNKAVVDFNRKATKSFNQIFLDMEKIIAESAFNVALSFEKDSGSRRIQSAVLDFSMNFQDSLNSFISNSLPDARKFDFTAATAGQKAQMLLQKSQQDYDKAIAEQANERSIFLNKSSENLMKEFKSSFLPSQASAEYFKQEILPQLQTGKFQGNAQSLASDFENKALVKAQTSATGAKIEGVEKTNVEAKLKQIDDAMEKLRQSKQTDSADYKNLITAQQDLIGLQKQIALFENTNAEEKMNNIIKLSAQEMTSFEQKQANAKKEAEINKQLTDVKIQADKLLATEKAKVDKENLMRLENMKNVSAAISNNLEISKARSNAKINTLQGDLADPRLDYGSSAKEVTGRKIAIESQILKTQRAEEDAAISAEIQQRVLQMAAEQENTSALYALNETIGLYMGKLLEENLGGAGAIAEMKNNPYTGKSREELDRMITSGSYMQEEVTPDVSRLEQIKQAQSYTPEKLAQFEAYQRTQQSKTSANVIGKLDAAGFNATGADGKLLMTQEDQLKTLTKMSEDYEKSGDVVAKGIVDRYKAEIINKKTSLAITRENIDEELRRKQILEQQSHILTERFKKGYSGMSAASDRMIEDLVERTPERFADGMTNALMEVAKGTKSIGDAFKDMAINFGQEMMQAVMRAAIGKMVGSAFTGLFGQAGGSVTSSKIGRQTGGIIHAQNGMYISGGRTGDKNLAMLEDGEYVLNREAVKSFGGVNNLDKMNYDMAPRFGKKMQGGGSVDLFAEMGINKKGENDYTGNLMSRSTNIGAINNSDYSAYAYAESDYFKKMQEKAIQDEQERVQKKFEKDQKNAQLISSIVGAVGSMFMAVGMAGMSADASSGKALAAGVTEKTVTGATPVVQKGLTEAAKQGPQALSQFAQKNAADILVKGQALNSLKTASEFARGISPDKLTGAFSKFSGGSQLGTILSEQGIQAAKKTAGSGILGNLFSTAVNTTGANVKKPRRQQTGGLIGFNNGGFVPYGSRLSDTIPALLTGGEYVMNNTAVKKYGLGKMNSMNTGAYQEGGSTASSSNNTNNNATSIAINIDKSGKSVYGANSSSYEKQDITFTKEMAQQINGIVLRSMSNEKRYGGELYKNSSRT